MPADTSESIRPSMRRMASFTRLLQHIFILWTWLPGEASNTWDLRNPLWRPQLNKQEDRRGELKYSDDRSAVEVHGMHLRDARPTNTAGVAQHQALQFDVAKRPLNGPVGSSADVGGKTTWSLRFPYGILGTNALGVLSSNMQSKPVTEAVETSPTSLDNRSSPLSFLVDTIQLPLVPSLGGKNSQRTSGGALSNGAQARTPVGDEDMQRRDGYIVGEEYSGPDFQPANHATLEEPPLFTMQNISLLPPQARKPINLAVRQFTAQMQRAAVDYCTANNLNCSEQHALETAISVALRTSPTASMFRQISASLSAVEGAITSALRPLGWPIDPRSPEAPKPPPKPPLQTAQAVQFSFSLVGTAVALLRSFIRLTKGPKPLIAVDTQLHEHHRNILLSLLYSGREREGCSMTAPLEYSSNCRSFAIEVPARTDNCAATATIQDVPSSLTAHGFELSCLSSLRCSQHYLGQEPFNLDGRYTLTRSPDGAVSFAKMIRSGLRQQNTGSRVLHLYQSEGSKTTSEVLKSAAAAISAAAGHFAHQQSSKPKECQDVDTFSFSHCLLYGPSHWRFTQVREDSPTNEMKYFPAIVSIATVSVMTRFSIGVAYPRRRRWLQCLSHGNIGLLSSVAHSTVFSNEF